MSATLVTIVLDRDACIGYGECVAEAPDIVGLEADGTARLLCAEVDAARAKAICGSCPTGALSVRR